MSITKEIEQEAAKIRAHLHFKTRVYAYWDGQDIVIKDKIYCNGGHQLIGTYDKWMAEDKGRDRILDRLKCHIDCLITHGHIPSSLGRWSELMRNSDITE